MFVQSVNGARLHPVKTLAGFLAMILMGVVCAGQARAQREPGTCMFVVRQADLSHGFDQAIHDRLFGLGYTVTLVEHSAFDTAMAATLTTYALCVISETISSSSVDEIVGVDFPLMHNEHYGWDNAGFAGPDGSNGTWFPDSSNSMEIQATTHTILTEAGVSAGTFALYNQLSGFANLSRTMYGKETSSFGSGVDILATGSGAESAYAVLWAYEQGAAMYSGSAPNRIVGMCIPGDEAGLNIPAADVRDEYWTLFVAAVHWLDPSSQSLPPQTPTPTPTPVPTPTPTPPSTFSLTPSHDAFVSNDSTVGPDVNRGGNVRLRSHDDSGEPRRTAFLVRFDSEGAITPPVSDSRLSLVSLNEGGNVAGEALSVYGVVESMDEIDESVLTWSNAPGVDNGAALNAPVQLDAADLTPVLTTFVTPTPGNRWWSELSQDLDVFINGDTDGILTFLVTSPPESRGIIAASKEYNGDGGAPRLEGYFGGASPTPTPTPIPTPTPTPVPELGDPFSFPVEHDTFVSNDTALGPESINGFGSGLHARDLSGTTVRRRAFFLRFATGGISDVSASKLRIYIHPNSANSPGTLFNVYGVLEDFDAIDEATLSWSNAPGVNAASAVDDPVQIDPADLTPLLTTYVAASLDQYGETQPSTLLDDFIDADTDGIVTFLIAPQPGSNGIIAASKEYLAGTVAARLEGFYGEAPPPTAPGAPTGVQAVGGATSIRMSWDVNPESNILGYKVYRDTVNDGPFTEQVTPYAINRTNFSDLNVTQDVTYHYKVSAVNTSLLESGKSASAPAVAATVPIPTAAAHWRFDDGSGTTATDASGNGNNGALTNFDPLTSWIEDGAVSGSLKLDGVDDLVIVPHGADFDFGDESFSVSLWIKQQGNHPYGPTDNENRWVMMGDFALTTEGTNGHWFGLFNKNHAARFSVDDNVLKSEIQVDSAPFVTGQWVHMVAIRDVNADQLSLYCNGLSQTSLNPANQAINGTDRTGEMVTTRPLTIGWRDPSDPTAPFKTGFYKGEIDDLRIFRKALSQAEVDELGALGPPAPTPTPTPIPTPWPVGEPPGAPAGLKATGGADSILLTWIPNSETNVYGYYVYRDTSSTGTFTQALNAVPIGDTAVIDEDVTMGVTYYYKVSAINLSALESAKSATASATAGSVALTMPNYRGEPGSNVSLRISAPNANGIAGDAMSFTVTYDPAVLTPTGVSKTALTQNVSFVMDVPTTGQALVESVASASETITGIGQLVNVQFQVAPGAALGTTVTHAFVSAALFDAGGQPLMLDTSDTALFTALDAFTQGDTDGDGGISQFDALLVQQSILGQATLTEIETEASDMNGDDTIDSADLILILRLAAGLPPNPPVLDQPLRLSGAGLSGPAGRTISVGSRSLEPGEEFLVPIEVDSGTGVAGADLTIQFDPTVADLLDVLPGESMSGFVFGKSVLQGKATVSLARATPLGAGPRELALLRFVATGERGEKTPLLFVSGKLWGEYANNLAWSETVYTSNGEIRINQAPTAAGDWTIYR
jgi:hypothetical protein